MSVIWIIVTNCLAGLVDILVVISILVMLVLCLVVVVVIVLHRSPRAPHFYVFSQLPVCVVGCVYFVIMLVVLMNGLVGVAVMIIVVEVIKVGLRNIKLFGVFLYSIICSGGNECDVGSGS